MADTTTWTGYSALSRSHGEKWTFGDKATVVLKYTGTFADCLAAVPDRGTAVTGYETLGLLVDTAEVNELEGEAGELVVTLVSPSLPEDDYGTEAVGDAVFEIDWNQVDKAIEQHPKCGELSTANDGTELKWEDWPKLATRPEAYVGVTGGWTLEQYLELKRAGVETYPLAAPVVRRTTFHFAKPSDAGVGVFTKQNPPISGFTAIAGFEWLKGIDRIVKRGRLYERSTEWLGADTVSELLYEDYPA